MSCDNLRLIRWSVCVGCKRLSEDVVHCYRRLAYLRREASWWAGRDLRSPTHLEASIEDQQSFERLSLCEFHQIEEFHCVIDGETICGLNPKFGSKFFRGTALLSLDAATTRTLFFFYRGFLIPTKPITTESRPKSERNDAIKRAYQDGIPISTIAKNFGISVQRVHQILQDKRK